MIDFENAKYIKLMHSDSPRLAQTVGEILVPGERVAFMFKSVRDSVIFTTKRVIAVNVQGVTGKKADFTSLPYARIQAFSVESAGMTDIDCEMILWFSGLGRVRFEFMRGVDVKALARMIGEAVL